MADADLEKAAQDLKSEAAALEAKAQVDSDSLVDQWLAEYFPATMFTRNSAGWQHISAAAAVLKRRLKGA